ncbi:hypothetical protein scyTo_0016539 [Scyliorhinus torazame]|uniref:Ion transport domain-containing protein n=1 Tax=Scyliorhinus torazame TaxID=75743 RepID=A0A401PT34_SCYTO|nr:hypothetical protein [Scyliorhinus torazame]
MMVKMVALGIVGKKCYLGDTWNRLDFFIVMSGMVEYSLDLQNVSLSAIRTVRVLRPLKAINRVPSTMVSLCLSSFFMINLCLVVIATQFSETKQREHQLMQEQRALYLSSSTVASFAEPGDCYEEIFQYVCHILRKAKRRTVGLFASLHARFHSNRGTADSSICQKECGR